MRRLVLLLALVGCGRVGFDRFDADAARAADAATCPADTVPIASGSPVCIEQGERGFIPWTDARDACNGLGRRLCSDAEWFTACVEATGIVDMIDGGYEWVAEESGGLAQKRGATDCTVTATHVVTDPYEYRCCIE